MSKIYVCQSGKRDGLVEAYSKDLKRALRWARLPEDTVLSPDVGDGCPPEPLTCNEENEQYVYQADVTDDVDGHSDIWVAVDSQRWHLWAGANLEDLHTVEYIEEEREILLRRVSGLED